MDGNQIGPIFEGPSLTNKITLLCFVFLTCKSFSASGLSYFRDIDFLSSVIEVVALSVQTLMVSS